MAPENPALDTVLIIGGGLTGLALAQGLKKKNDIKSVVFERESEFVERPRDWNIGLHWGTPILQSLIPPEAFAQLESAQVDPNTPCLPEDTIPFLHGQTGEQIGGTTLPHVYRLRRKELRSIISKGLDIEYNKTLTALEYSEDGKTVTATFQDGSSFTGSLVVGADGARSEVRNLIVGQPGAELTVLPFACSIVQAKFTAEQAKFLRSVHPLYLAMIHPESMVGWLGLHYAPDPNVPEDWIMNHYISWPCSPEEYDKTKDFDNYQRLKQVQSLAEKFADPIKSAFLWLPEDQDVWFSMLTQWDPSLPEHSWDNKGGRVTLAGDAAHPMTFQRGQGLNSAFKDAEVLVTEISTFLAGQKDAKTRKEAIDAYEEEMKKRAGNEVRLSEQSSRMVHIWDLVMESPVMKHGFTKQNGSK